MPRPCTRSTSGSRPSGPDVGVDSSRRDRRCRRGGRGTSRRRARSARRPTAAARSASRRAGQVVVEVDRLPRVERDGPGRRGTAARARRWRVEPVRSWPLRPSPDQRTRTRGSYARPGRDRPARCGAARPHRAGHSPLGGALRVVGVVAAPRRACRPDLAEPKVNPGGPATSDRVASGRCGPGGLAQVRAVHHGCRCGARSWHQRPVKSRSSVAWAPTGSAVRSQRGEVEVAVGSVGHRRPRGRGAPRRVKATARTARSSRLIISTTCR